MTFRTITPQPGRVPTEVSLSVIAYADRATRVRVNLHADMLKMLGWPEKAKIEVQVGDGPDTGYIRLRLAGDVGFRMKRGGNTSRWLVQFKPPAGAPSEMKSVPVKFFVNSLEHSLKIRLPWAESVLRAAE